MPALKRADKLFIAGHRGLVGSAITRRFQDEGFDNVVTRTRQELDLEDQAAVYAFLEKERFDAIVVAAAKVGGIGANSTYPADFIGHNLAIENNLIWGGHLAGVPNLLFLGSSCIYPRETPQPIPEDALLTGKPEPTNAPYAIAKIAGLYLCDAIREQYGRNYFTIMPPNVYGPNDNYDLKTSHVLPALIRKFHEALPDQTVECWGTGSPKREFMHSDDVADAAYYLLTQDAVPFGHLNVGWGESISIRDLAETIKSVTGHRGEIFWNTAYPDGFPEKTMDVSRAFGLGWRPKIDLKSGIARTYSEYRESLGSAASLQA